MNKEIKIDEDNLRICTEVVVISACHAIYQL